MRTKLLSALMLLTLSLSAQTQVTNYQPGVTAEGITYCLPRTKLYIQVALTVETTFPGDFCAYAERYLRVKDVPDMKQTQWTIRSINVTPFGAPDASKMYSIALRPKTAAPLVSLSKDGILLAINAASVPDPVLPKDEQGTKSSTWKNARNYMTEEILAAGSTTKMAELTANEIYDIRDSRSQLSKGQADYMPKDGEQMKVMLAKLDEQEAALLQLFKGYTETETKMVSLTYDPTKDVDGEILFRFSTALGIVDKDDLAGDPVYISIKDEKTVPQPLESADAVKMKKKDTPDIRYNVPSKVDVKIYDRSKSYSQQTFPMGQFGNVEELGADLFNKKFTTHITFFPSTGAIDRLEAEQPK